MYNCNNVSKYCNKVSIEDSLTGQTVDKFRSANTDSKGLVWDEWGNLYINTKPAGGQSHALEHVKLCRITMPAGGQSQAWEHVKVWFKHHACCRSESCVRACKGVV